MFSCKLNKLSRNREFLIVQGNFGKFIDVLRRKSDYLRVYLRNVS